MTKQAATRYAKYLFEKRYPEDWKVRFGVFVAHVKPEAEAIIRCAEWLTGPDPSPENMPRDDDGNRLMAA